MVRLLIIVCLAVTSLGQHVFGATEDDFYRIVSIATSQTDTTSRSPQWKPADGEVALEVSGIAALDQDRVAVAIRKGEVWILGGVYDDPPSEVTYHRFASGLHEPLGLLQHGDSLYTVQRTELTRLRDTDGDQVADEYLTVANGWGVSGHYHEYAYGPKFDGDGNLWLTLNIGMGLKGEQLDRTLVNGAFGYRQARWRGWGMKVTPAGDLIPVCAGMRSPSGLGANAAGDMFYTDQQGNWVPTCSLHQMQPGAFFHHPEALASMNEEGSPLQGITKMHANLPYPEALRQNPWMRAPAAWFPYKKAGQSTTDIVLDESDGAFGPFAGQLFVGEFTQASIFRVFLEQVEGQYQGAVFPFRRRFGSAVLRLCQGADGSLWVGLTNRGWSSLGPDAYGLQRLVWTGRTPFEIKTMRARHDGFELEFTKPIDPTSVTKSGSLALRSYTYQYHATYGSDEILGRELEIGRRRVSADGRRLDITVAGMREAFVHELLARGVRSAEGEPLLHDQAYYTLNVIPAQ